MSYKTSSILFSPNNSSYPAHGFQAMSLLCATHNFTPLITAGSHFRFPAQIRGECAILKFLFQFSQARILKASLAYSIPRKENQASRNSDTCVQLIREKTKSRVGPWRVEAWMGRTNPWPGSLHMVSGSSLVSITSQCPCCKTGLTIVLTAQVCWISLVR